VPAEDLARLRAHVLSDPQLQHRLLAVPDRRQFVALVLSLAAERGLDIGAEDVEGAIVESRRAWYSTWI
jgi:hypothetical protein